MKRILWIFIMLLFTSSCSGLGLNTQVVDNIRPPEVQEVIIQGTWEIDSIGVSVGSGGAGTPGLQVGDKVYFDKNLALISERYTAMPEYSSKLVNKQNFINYKYPTSTLKEEIADENAVVVSISDGDRFYQDIIIEGDNLLFAYDGTFYTAKRLTAHVEKDIISKYNALDKELRHVEKNQEKVDTALLLGLRRTEEKDNQTEVKYLTYFIRRMTDGRFSIYLAPNLFLPNQTSFWEVKHERQRDEDKFVEVVSANEYPVDEGNGNATSSSQELIITNVNPEYISIASRAGELDITSYSMREIEGLSSPPLKIIDVVGKEGFDIYQETITKELASLNLDEEAEAADSASNIGIARTNGSWTFVNQLNYENGGITTSKRVDLNILPFIEGNIDRENGLNWSSIRNMVPNAIDYVSSPSGNIFVIMSPDELLVYTKEDTTSPVVSIPLQGNNTMVMEEWTSNQYASLWEEAFVQTKRIPAEYNVN